MDTSKFMGKLKEIIEIVKDEIKWILAGMPKPVPIKVKNEE